MKNARLALLAGLTPLLVFIGCDLNPQPLPPLDPNQATAGNDAGFNYDAKSSVGEDGQDEESLDAGAIAPPQADGGGSGGADGGDAGLEDGGGDDAGDGDAGDAGDGG